MDSIEMSLCELDLRFYFVTADGGPPDADAEDQQDMICCFERIADRFDSADSYSWITPADCLALARSAQPPLTRKSVFIFQRFEGAAFDHLRTATKALLLGPKCIIDCLLHDTNIPNVPASPIYNVALREHFVCASGLRAAERERVQQLVHYMGGQFTAGDLAANTTYLVAGTTMSVKYERAVSFGIRTVTAGWVEALWLLSERSAAGESLVLSADSGEEWAHALYEKHRIPIFHQLGITSTGIGVAQRAHLKQLIEANGGVYHGSFKSELIHILMVARTQTASEKFRAAVKCRKTCLTPEWFTDSVERGYALPIEEYRVHATHATTTTTGAATSTTTAAGQKPALAGSTPTKEGLQAPTESAFNADCTNLSDIMGNVTVNESRMTTTVCDQSRVSSLTKGQQETAYKVVLANINVQQAKRSGAFLDGCNVHLCGFTADERDKLTKILTNACATRFDEYDSRVEYVLVGQPAAAELPLIASLAAERRCVTVGWLVASIADRCPAPERSHLYTLPTSRSRPSPDAGGGNAALLCASPASKKNMASMSGSFRRPQPRRLQMDAEAEQQQQQQHADMMSQYLVAAPQAAATADPVPERPSPPTAPPGAAAATSANACADATDATGAADCTDAPAQYFAGLTFFVDGFTADSEETLIEDIELAGGQMVSARHRGTVDYVIVPLDHCRPAEVAMRGRQLVNEHWVADAAQEQRCVDIAYYHRPFEWPVEEEDGDGNQPLAGMQLVLTTYAGSERIYLSSIGRIMGADVQERYIKTQKPVLICPRPEGAKYNGAIKWRLPVVSCAWLLECARLARRVAMRPYLVGDSVAPANEPAAAADAHQFERPDAVRTMRPALLDAGGGRGFDAGASTDSLQITAVDAPPAAAPLSSSSSAAEEAPQANKATAAPRRRPSSPAAAADADVSNESLKRQRPADDDFGGDGAGVAHTPQLKHPRLSEIVGGGFGGGRKSSLGGAGGCATPGSPASSQAPVDYATQLKSNLACVETPCRDLVFRTLMHLKEIETPETRRRLQALSTPDLLRSPLPAELRTPAHRERMRAVEDMHYRGWVPSPAPTTPFAEVQRRFWKNALGDEYVSPSQQQRTQPDDSQTQQQQQKPHPRAPALTEVAAGAAAAAAAVAGNISSLFNGTQEEDFAAGVAPAATSTQLLPGAAGGAAAAVKSTEHIKRLSDFIQKRRTTDSGTPTKPAVNADEAAAAAAATANNGAAATATQSQQHPLTEAMGGSEVGWRDPADFAGAAAERQQRANAMQHRGTPRFNISCLDAQRLERIQATIRRLGGELCEQRGGYDPTCTHVLCERPSRSEKIFSAIAAGKWLLHLRYAEDSALAGEFVNEELYEFGNPAAVEQLAGVTSRRSTKKEADLNASDEAAAATADETGRAAYRWRRQLQAARERMRQRDPTGERIVTCGVFSAFRVILHTNKKAAFRNLLEAGGGIVLDVTEPYERSKEALTATHCVLDSRNKLSSRDRQALAAVGVACVNITFLQAYVSLEMAPDPLDYPAPQ